MRASALRATLACSIAAAVVHLCDDDDTMLPHALETLLVLAKSTGADVVRGGYRLLRANAAGTAVELPHPPGQAIIIHKPAGQGYLQFFAAKRAAVCLERYVPYKLAGPSAL